MHYLVIVKARIRMRLLFRWENRIKLSVVTNKKLHPNRHEITQIKNLSRKIY